MSLRDELLAEMRDEILPRAALLAEHPPQLCFIHARDALYHAIENGCDAEGMIAAAKQAAALLLLSVEKAELLRPRDVEGE